MKKLLTIPLILTTVALAPTTAIAHPWQYHVGGAAHARNGVDVANAQTDTAAKTRAAEIKTKVDEFKAAPTNDQKLAVLKEVCAKMVDHRTKTLEHVKGKIEDSKLTTTQKEEITTVVDTKTPDLTRTKTECANETNLETLKTKVRDLQKKENVFKNTLPKLHGLNFVKKGEAFIGRLNNHTAVIQRRINEALANGCDVTSSNAALVDYRAAIAEAQAHLAKAKDLIALIKEAEDAGALRDQLKAEMTAMRDALLRARDANKVIKNALKDCREPKPAE